MRANFGRKFWRVPGHHLHIKHDADPRSKLGGWPFKEFAYVPALTLIENGPYNHACCSHPEAGLWRHNVYNYIRRRHGSSLKWSMFRVFFGLLVFSNVLCCVLCNWCVWCYVKDGEVRRCVRCVRPSLFIGTGNVHVFCWMCVYLYKILYFMFHWDNFERFLKFRIITIQMNMSQNFRRLYHMFWLYFR